MTIKTKRVVWTIVFLGITLAAIVMEVVAGIFHPAGTIPWTEYLARYVPWPFQLLAYVALATWLPFHFWRHDHLRKAAFHAGVHEGLAAAKAGGPLQPNLGLATTQQMLEELKTRGEVGTIAWGGLSDQRLHDQADLLLKTLSPGTLIYRSVDGN